MRYDNSPEYNASQLNKFHRDERIGHQLSLIHLNKLVEVIKENDNDGDG